MCLGGVKGVLAHFGGASLSVGGGQGTHEGHLYGGGDGFPIGVGNDGWGGGGLAEGGWGMDGICMRVR